MTDKTFNWNKEKNELLKKSERKVSFEQVVIALKNQKLLDVIPSPTHSGQLCFVVEIDNYCYIVPFVEENKTTLFLKTIYPSRKFTKYYLRRNNEKR